MFRQLLRFAGVGALSTLTHVIVALAVSALLGLTPMISNLAGFTAAFCVSYFGHGLYTFEISLAHRQHGPRFFIVSAIALCISSAITYVITDLLEQSLLLAMGLIAIAIPIVTFIVCKFWVFTFPQKDS